MIRETDCKNSVFRTTHLVLLHHLYSISQQSVKGFLLGDSRCGRTHLNAIKEANEATFNVC